jgi:dCTP deaminase
MILTGDEIVRMLELGDITIDPFSAENVNPNSYNYRLGPSCIEIPHDTYIDVRKPPTFSPTILPESGKLLRPGYLYLCGTMERIGSERFVTSLIGRSLMGRLGLYLQVSANIGHQGETHRWTLELRCITPIIVYPGMIIGQVTFWATTGEREGSRGYYAQFDSPKPSRGVE